MVDAYTILVIQSIGNVVLMVISFIGFGLFFFTGYPNGISRWFGFTLLCVGTYAASLGSTKLAVVFGGTSSPAQLNFFYWFWLRETATLWLTIFAILALGVYLLRHKNE